MASFDINTGVPDFSAQILNPGQTDIVERGNSLDVSASGSVVAITWKTGGTIEVDNYGSISASSTSGGNSRGIDTSGSLSAGSNFAFNNASGASLTSLSNDAIRINADIFGGSVTINNSSTIVSGSVDALGNISGTVSGGEASSSYLRVIRPQ
jgi:hypothetical protein